VSGRTLKTAETVDGALAPALTPWDRKILRAVPAHVDIRTLLNEPGQHGVTVWRVAEGAHEMDLEAVLMTLHGLQRRWLVRALGSETQRKSRRWIRTELGDEELGA
jgi:hypothetical protein